MRNFLLKIAFVAVFSLVFGYTAYNFEEGNDYVSSSMLDNVEALAGGEIEIAFCAHVTDRICVLFSDGMFIRGYHQY